MQSLLSILHHSFTSSSSRSRSGSRTLLHAAAQDEDSNSSWASTSSSKKRAKQSRILSPARQHSRQVGAILSPAQQHSRQVGSAECTQLSSVGLQGSWFAHQTTNQVFHPHNELVPKQCRMSAECFLTCDHEIIVSVRQVGR